jgi:hypothetical protein
VGRLSAVNGWCVEMAGGECPIGKVNNSRPPVPATTNAPRAYKVKSGDVTGSKRQPRRIIYPSPFGQRPTSVALLVPVLT